MERTPCLTQNQTSPPCPAKTAALGRKTDQVCAKANCPMRGNFLSLPVGTRGARQTGLGPWALNLADVPSQHPGPLAHQSTGGASCPNSSQPLPSPKHLSQLPGREEEVRVRGHCERPMLDKGETKSPCFEEKGVHPPSQGYSYHTWSQLHSRAGLG